MSFRLFIYYCAAWGAATALCGWAVGRLLAVDSALGVASLKGLALGAAVALGLGVIDALAAGGRVRRFNFVLRLLLALVIGTLGGLLGGFIGQALFQGSGGRWTVLLILGWALTGFLIGAAPSAFDFLASLVHKEDLRGVRRKVRNGIIGGTIGGIVGGTVSVLLHAMWASVFGAADPDAADLWSPSATGFVALGACIGLAVALAQVILGEAWLRVEAGFRPGRQLLLTRSPITIGRSEGCDIGLFGDPAIERTHARITRQGNYWLLTDAETPGGTYLNGQRISGPAMLRSRDRIQVGNSVLAFDLRTRETAPPPPAIPVSI
jgi:hypothetical protein